VAGACECGNEPSDSIKCRGDFLNNWGPVSSSGRIALHGVV
jgi:hypothetical protein